MDMSDLPPAEGKSPRRELQLQGPRPAPLRVRKDSHKIRKPPVAPSQQYPPPQAPPRPPVIIYTVSPKIIHANPSEFMSLVQRLTGAQDHSTCTTSSSSSSMAAAAGFQDGFNRAGAISPAACFASIERTRTPQGKRQPQPIMHDVTGDAGMVEFSSDVERSACFPGVLSPNPASLPPIPPNFFSPPSDQNPLGFSPDLIWSPALQSNRNYYSETNFLIPSPSTINNFISPRFIISPGTPSLDLFNNLFFDL